MFLLLIGYARSMTDITLNQQISLSVVLSIKQSLDGTLDY